MNTTPTFTPSGYPVGVPVQIWEEPNRKTFAIFDPRGCIAKMWLTQPDGKTPFCGYVPDYFSDLEAARPPSVRYRAWHYPELTREDWGTM